MRCRLLYRSRPSTNDPYELRLGERALAEIGVRDITEFVLQITNKQDSFSEEDLKPLMGAYTEVIRVDSAEEGDATSSEDEGGDAGNMPPPPLPKGKGKGKGKRHREHADGEGHGRRTKARNRT